MKKHLLIIFMFVFAWLTSFSQNVTKQCTPGAVYYSCGATTAYQSEQGPWFDLVVNGNQNNGYQAYGIDWATWKEYDNGTAQLTGRLYQIINKVNVKFDMNFTFSNKGAGTPHGGGDGWHCIPSSTSDWSYYNSMSGTLTGVSGTQAAGINFTAQIVNGTSLQIGTGGSTNSPIKYGMSAWLHLTQTGGWNQCWNKGGGTDLYFDLNNCTTPCSNFTSGGAICCDQTGCSPFNPTIINNQTSPTGGSGAIEYIWLKSITASTYTTANASQWQTITGATGASYDPDAISQTTWYIRCARRSGCVNYTGESNIVKITVTSPCVTPPTTCVVRTVSNGQSICSSNVYGFWYNSVFYTVGTGMTFTENSDGTAKLVGTFVKTGETVAVNVTFTGRTTTAPLNSPKYGNCINSGGTSWYYYSAFTGTLQFSTGANISISQSGPAFQVGYGANLNDNTFGAAAWFKNSAGAQVGDFNFRLSEIGTACTTCNNLTSGGSIGSNQSGCSPYTSTMINNIVLPSGGDATKAIEYVWLKTTDPNGSTNLPTCDGNGVVNLKSWVEIAGANAASYNPGTVNQTTWYLRCARRAGCVCYYGESNLVKITITGACPTCNNLTSGGSIGSDQSGCLPYLATMINSIVLPSGGDATKAIEYVWLKTTDPNGPSNLPTCDANGIVNLKSWTEIAGANAESYNPGTITQTTWYLRCARRAGCVCYYGESNIVKITVTGNCGTCPNLVTNGSFSAGFTSFQTDIPQKGGPACSNGGAAAVRPNPNQWGFSANCTDQDGNGAQLLIDFPSGDVWQKIWAQTVNVQQNTTYTFTFWAQSIYPSNPGQLFAMINTQVYPVKTLPTTTCQWVKYEVLWNSGMNTSATLLIKNANAECVGNDFGIDNISFSCNGGGTPGTCNVTVSATNNGPKCTGQNVQLSANGVSTSSGGNSGISYGNNLVVNGNFQNGNTGFTSELTYKAWDGGCDNYSVTSTPKNDWKWPADCQDHTGGTGGKMAIFDSPGGDAWKVYWKQCITVEPNTTYEFSYWAMSLFSGNPARLYAVINNMNAGNVTPQTLLSSTTCQWQKITFTWNSGSATSACIMIKNDNGDCNGNDFAIDDVLLRKVITTPPQTCTPSYSWSGPNGFSSNQQNPSVSVAGIYSVIFKDQYCCTANATTTVVINTNPVANVTGNLSVCNNGTTTLTATGGRTYAWNNGATSPSITVGAGTYTVVVTNASGCTDSKTVTVTNNLFTTKITGNLSVCTGSTTTLTASGGGTYTWNNGATTQSITAGTGTYSVTVTNSTGCTATATATVVNTTVSVRIIGNLSVCTGATTLLTASGNGTYKWSNGATSQSIAVGVGTYSVTLTNADGCTAVATTTVVTSLVPQTNITGNLLVCTGTTTLLTASGIGTYKWSNGATSQSITVGAGTYSVTVTNSAGCTAKATATVVNSAANVSITGSLLVCTGATTQLTANGTGTYKWSNGATTQSITVGVGTYSVTLTTATGCTALNSAVVTTKDCNTSSIGDLVFCDKNGNGTQDAGEPGIPNVTIYLTGTATNGQPVNLVKTTDANGKYLFSNLPAGTYKLTVVKPTGYLATVQDFGSNDAIDSDINPSTGMTNNISLGVNETNLTVDAGFYQLGSIGDFVFNDTNKNGVQDAGEIGIPNVTVVLNGIMNGIPVTYVTSTDANGKYNFPNLLPGTYKVTFTKPAGYNASPMDQGDDTKDSDANPTTGTTSTITLTGGQNNTTIDAGFYKPTLNIISIGDFVFLDCNKNGIQDAGEQGLAGVTVTLKNASGAVVTSTPSGVNGAYSFNNITEGTYSLTFSIAQNLTGFAFTAQNQGTNDAIDSDVNTNGETGLITFTTTNTTVDAGVMDIGAPVINNVPADVTVDCGSLPSIPSNITATDNYDTAPSISMITSTTPLAGQNQYLLKRTWTATDKCGNKSTKTWTICVKDAQAPVFLNLPPSVTVECNAIPPAVYPGVKDNCDLKIPVSLSQTIIAGNCPDNYIIKRLYTANDDAGNSITYVQYVTVQDTKAPVLTGVPADVTILCGQTIPSPPAPGVVKATDNCDANVTITFSEVYYAGNCNGVGVIKCQWTATDNCGNTTAKIWTITIDSNASSFIQNTNNNSIVLPMAITRSVLENESVVNENVVIYPNPTSGEFVIDLGDVQASRLNITNEMGQILYTVEQPKNKVQVNLNASQKGLHTVQIFTSKGILTKKVVVIE